MWKIDSNSDSDMIVDGRWAGLSISADLQELSSANIFGVYSKLSEKEKYPLSSSSLGLLLMVPFLLTWLSRWPYTGRPAPWDQSWPCTLCDVSFLTVAPLSSLKIITVQSNKGKIVFKTGSEIKVNEFDLCGGERKRRLLMILHWI